MPFRGKGREGQALQCQGRVPLAAQSHDRQICVIKKYQYIYGMLYLKLKHRIKQAAARARLWVAQSAHISGLDCGAFTAESAQYGAI